MAEKQGIGFFDVGAACPDLVIENGTLKADNTLHTPCLISLHSDRRVAIEDLPPGISRQQGWWADQFGEVFGDQIGSRMWTLARAKLVSETPVELESIILQAFDWMIEDGIAESVTVVESERTGTYSLKGTVNIQKPEGEDIPFKFIWDGQKLELFNR